MTIDEMCYIQVLIGVAIAVSAMIIQMYFEFIKGSGCDDNKFLPLFILGGMHLTAFSILYVVIWVSEAIAAWLYN